MYDPTDGCSECGTLTSSHDPDCQYLQNQEDAITYEYEVEREKLAEAIQRRVNSSSIARTTPYSVGDAERAVAAVISEGWTPPPGYAQEVEETPQRYVMVQDDSGDDYIIFAEYRDEWDELTVEELMNGVPWAFPLNGSLYRVTFTDPKIEGKPLKDCYGHD